MGTGVGSNDNQFYRADMRMVGKKSVEWDLNDWKWDGDHFTASPVNCTADEHRSHQLFPSSLSGIPNHVRGSNTSSPRYDEVNLEVEKGKNEMEKRRRVIVIEDASLNNNLDDGTGNLSLQLGGNGYERESEILEGTGVKKAKCIGAIANRAICQVEDCDSDLRAAKDYHRRHKVCERHSKAAEVRVGNAMQRFCQQCSRFHALQEFDEGKRSCRRRLAGHNKRRRKRQPETVSNGNSQNDEQSSEYLLISLLKILSNMHSNKSDHRKDQDLIAHLLRSIASTTGAHVGESIPGIPTESQGLLNNRAIGNSEVVCALPSTHHLTIGSCSSQIPYNDAREVRDSKAEQTKLNNFDLNDVYVDSDDATDDLERYQLSPKLGFVTSVCPLWLHQDSHRSSPPQTGRNSDAASAQSPSSTRGEDESRTDRIVFKLFGKAPKDLPNVLRAQILDWLSHSPTEIESYIKPGCVVLTIYLRLTVSEWDEICYDLSSSLSRLLAASDDTFWRTGWVYIRVQHQIAFIYNGQVVLNASLPPASNNYTKILGIKPIAICTSEKAQFSIKGLNLSRPSSRVLCALEGQYLVQENTHELIDGVNSRKEHDEFQCINFSCSIPNVIGRGFFEVEDNGLSSSFFPFIIAEKDICSEICMLENAINIPETVEGVTKIGKSETKTQAMDFICEMGWLLRRTQLKSRLGHSDPNTDLFPLKRFKWLIEFSMDHDWHAVVKKLLDIFLNGKVSSGEHESLKYALIELGLLHRAVRRNSRSLVNMLLRYTPKKVFDLENEWKYLGNKEHKNFLFAPDAAGPAGLTPLHIAAGRDGSENVLDALLDDPGMVAIKAWKNASDSTGFTPEDYARLRGHYSYIHLVQKKINRRPISGQVALDILGDGTVSDQNTNEKNNKKLNSGFEIGKRFGPKNCKLCDQRQLISGYATRSLLYRPAVFSMIAIAAVCVCVALLFKSSPEVLFVFRPFRWEMLDYGSS